MKRAATIAALTWVFAFMFCVMLAIMLPACDLVPTQEDAEKVEKVATEISETGETIITIVKEVPIPDTWKTPVLAVLGMLAAGASTVAGIAGKYAANRKAAIKEITLGIEIVKNGLEPAQKKYFKEIMLGIQSHKTETIVKAERRKLPLPFIK